MDVQCGLCSLTNYNNSVQPTVIINAHQVMFLFKLLILSLSSSLSNNFIKSYCSSSCQCYNNVKQLFITIYFNIMHRMIHTDEVI